LKKVNKRDVIVIMGDFNAKIGENWSRLNSNAIGPYGLGERNPRGDRMEDFAVENDLVIVNTISASKTKTLHVDIAGWKHKKPNRFHTYKMKVENVSVECQNLPRCRL